MDIPETKQAKALQRVADLGAERADLLAKAKALLEPIREACLEAEAAGARRSRIQRLSRMSPNIVYGWLKEAGAEPKRRGNDA